MKMKEGELKIFFKESDAPTREKLETELKKFLRQQGYREWASGMNMETWVRDIAFDRR